MLEPVQKQPVSSPCRFHLGYLWLRSLPQNATWICLVVPLTHFTITLTALNEARGQSSGNGSTSAKPSLTQPATFQSSGSLKGSGTRSNGARSNAPRTSWDEQVAPAAPGMSERTKESSEQPISDRVAPDLQALYDRAQAANSVIEYNSVIDNCRTVIGDNTRLSSERTYTKRLLSWAANRRGELRSDMAGKMVASQQFDDAEKLDRSAAEDFQLSIQFDPGRWRAYHNLGIARALTGNIDEAIELFSKTIELNPKFADAYNNRGEMHARNRNWKQAIVDFGKAIELSPDDSGLHRARATALFSNGDTEAALADFQSAMRLDPESAETASEYADTCQSLGRWKDAAEAYQKSLKLAPSNPQTLQNAAWMMATCPEDFYRNPEAAVKTAERAVRAAGNAPSASLLHVLGVSQASNGDFDTAIATLNEALQTTTDPSLRREIGEHRALFQRKRPFVQSAPQK